MKTTVEDGKLVFKIGKCTARYTLSFIQKKIKEFETELIKWKEYEKLLIQSTKNQI